VPNEHGTAVVVEVGLVERERLTDAQPSSPQHHDHGAQANSFGALAGGAHDGDDLLDGRGIGRVPHALVAWRHAAVEACGGGR
jgi:hypothetical protein